MDNYSEENLSLWNDLTAIHWQSMFYDVDRFRSGKSSLKPFEIDELGDVSGLSLLHLQCHFGLDTLSWARRGAKVTGVDFSEEAIALARSLSRDLGIEARFLCSDIYQLPTALDEQFDIIFTSYGVLCWLPDLQRWARVLADLLKPGGFFYIIDYHPMSNLLTFPKNDLPAHYPFSRREEPQHVTWQGTYADPSIEYSHEAHLWEHGLSDVINAIIMAELRLEYVHEFPYCLKKTGETGILQMDDDRVWNTEESKRKHSLLFSLKATREERARQRDEAEDR